MTPDDALTARPSVTDNAAKARFAELKGWSED